MRRAAFIAAWIPCSTAHAAEDPVVLFPMGKDGRRGCVDRTGRVAIAPRFERARAGGRLLGYVDTAGRHVRKPTR